MPIRTLIVDDMRLARNRLRRHLDGDDEIEIVGEASGGQEAIDAIRHLTPDLVFLDVQMPEVDGFAVLEAVGPGTVPAIVFVTAHDQFALRAFEMHALDYLLKPFDDARLQGAIARAKRAIAGAETAATAGKLRALLAEMGVSSAHPRRITIKVDGRTLFLQLDEIDYIEAAGNYLRIRVGTEAYMIREKIGDMERRLDSSRFARIHRSTIVNIDRIKEMQPLFNGDQIVILRNGKRLTLSRTYREHVVKQLDRL